MEYPLAIGDAKFVPYNFIYLKIIKLAKFSPNGPSDSSHAVKESDAVRTSDLVCLLQ